MQVNDNSSLVRALKTAFYERAYAYAAELQRQVEAGALTSEQANHRMVEIMSHPDEMQAVIEASTQYQNPN